MWKLKKESIKYVNGRNEMGFLSCYLFHVAEPRDRVPQQTEICLVGE